MARRKGKPKKKSFGKLGHSENAFSRRCSTRKRPWDGKSGDGMKDFMKNLLKSMSPSKSYPHQKIFARAINEYHGRQSF
jgi:hypothetical protein